LAVNQGLASNVLKLFWSFFHINGTVSRDWGRLQMVLLDRYEVRTIPLDVYFFFKIHFSNKFFQNGVSLVAF
jgi:hypothetical protein